MKHTPLTVERDSPMKNDLHIKMFHEGLEYAWFRWGGNCFSGWLTDEQISQLFASVNGYPALQQQRDELLTILDDLETSFDRQTFDEMKGDDYDVPDDREYAVNITAKQLREISSALAKARAALSLTQAQGK